jgi:large subunit ribosomal protein L10
MSKPVKAMVTAELTKRYAGTDSACVVDLTGMNVQEQEQLRGLLQKTSARVQVVKNSLARRAFEGGPLEPLGQVLKGPCALVVSSESLIETAKALVDAAKEFEKLELKQAILEGQPDLLTVVELSKLKSRKEMIGDLASLISAPGRAVAACLSAPQSRIAGCLEALVEKAA